MKLFHRFVAVSLVGFCAFPFAASAESLTTAQLQAEIQSLVAKVQSLQTQLATAQSGSLTVWCYTFDSNLEIGNTGPDVQALQQALSKDGETINVTGTFDEQTASAVTGFQEKYASQILTPNGLRNGTGYVGKSTRAKLNSLFGCSYSTPTPTTTLNPSPEPPSSETLNLALDPTIAAQSQSVVPGGTGYIFVVADLTAANSALTVNSLNFGCGGYACNGVTNLRMVGVRPNTETWAGSTSNEQTFNPSLIIPAGTTQVVELIGDVSPNAQVGQQMAFSLTYLSVTLGTGTVAGSAFGNVLTVAGSSSAPSISLQVNGSNGPTTVSSGAPLDLTWSSTDIPVTCGVSFNPTGAGTYSIGSGLSGSATVNAPTVSTLSAFDYEASCPTSGTGGPSISDTVQVNVTPSSGSVTATVPPSVPTSTPTAQQSSFTVSPTSIASGNSATFFWNGGVNFSINCVSGVTMYDDGANVPFQCGSNNNSILFSGQKAIQFQYVSTSTNPTQVVALLSTRGTALTATVSVAPVLPSTVTLNINGSHGPLSVSAGSQLNFSVTSANVSSCSENGPVGSTWFSGWSSTIPTAETVSAPTSSGSYPYIVVCLTPTGLEVTDAVTVNVP